jgi:hypothetical protein
MTELENLEQELTASLAALEEKPCGCHETSTNPFGEYSASGDLASELQSALGSLGTGDDTGQISAEELAEFASVADTSAQGLENVMSILEQNPGLKITFSL